MLEVLKAYSLFPFCTHHRSETKIIIKRYGLNVSLCMGLLCNWLCFAKVSSNECGDRS